MPKERHGLGIPRGHFQPPLLEIIRSAGSRAQVEALGGYDTSEMGRTVAELGP